MTSKGLTEFVKVSQASFSSNSNNFTILIMSGSAIELLIVRYLNLERFFHLPGKFVGRTKK